MLLLEKLINVMRFSKNDIFYFLVVSAQRVFDLVHYCQVKQTTFSDKERNMSFLQQ